VGALVVIATFFNIIATGELYKTFNKNLANMNDHHYIELFNRTFVS